MTRWTSCTRRWRSLTKNRLSGCQVVTVSMGDPMKTRLMIAAALLVVVAGIAFGQLSMAKADWARGPVQYLMTKEEQAAWNAVKSDAEADRFIALFWARRDPTPRTPQNEFREEFDRRVQYAEEHFSTSRQKGSLSDRGKVLVLFGAPTHAMRSGGGGGFPSQSATATDTAGEGTPETQTWIYEGPTADKLFGATRVEFRFVDRMGNKDLRLEPPRIDFAAAQQHVVSAMIAQPNLTTLPTQQPTPPVPQPAAAPASVAPMTSLKTPAYETAVTDAKAGKAAAKGALVNYAEFVAPSGDYFRPAQL